MLDDEAMVPLDEIQIDENLNYIERPVAVPERKMKTMCNNEIPL